MSIIARVTTWASLQTLTASDLNNEFNNIVNLFNNLDSASSTWSNVKISSTASNPMQVTSSAASSELSTDCTGTNGTPIHTWKRSGTQYYTAGVDGAASNAFKIGTSSLTTNISLQIPSSGSQIQVQPGLVGTPGMAFIGQATDGIWSPASGTISVTTAGSEQFRVGNSVIEIRGTTVIQNLSGSASAPTYTFTTQQNLGVYKGGTSILGFSTAGAQRMILDALGSVIIGTAAVLTTATDGFLYIPSCAGTPTGVATTYTGRNAMVYDTSAHKFWIYDSGWKGVAVS